MLPVEKTDPHTPDSALIKRAAQALARGELVVFPTETVYGLGAHGLMPRALARIFTAKARPTTHPLILHVSDLPMAKSIARVWPEAAEKIARAQWPGPVTLIVEKAEHVPPEATGGGESVGIRIPQNAIALSLIRALGAPIAAPSANRYQTLSPTHAKHVDLEGVSLVIDGGPTAHGIESTVIDVRGPIARILRPGALGVAEVRALLGRVDATPTVADADSVHLAPGMDAKHYAPRARIFFAKSKEVAHRLIQENRQKTLGVLSHTFDAGEGISFSRRLANDPHDYGRDLFEALHSADAERVEVLVVEAVPETDGWWAVRDRLSRAAHRE